MRKAAGYFAILMSVALLFFSTAGASPAWAWSNATAAVVKDTGVGSAICTFHIVGTGWDSSATGTWDIKLATGTTVQLNGGWTANTSGSWTTASITTLANGDYTLHVRQSTPAAGGDKNIPLTINCGTGGTTTSTGTSGSTGTSTSTSTSTGTSGTTSTSTTTGGGKVVINAKALTDHECNSSEWHFVITGVSGGNAPASITVAWSNGATASVALDRVTGNVAHYTTTLNLGSTVTGASAMIASSWSGQFNLSHGPCNAATNGGTTGTSGNTTTTGGTSTSTTGGT